MPSTWYQAINPMFIFHAHAVAQHAVGLAGHAQAEPSSVTKMAMGCSILGLSFLPLIFISRGLSDTARITAYGWWGARSFTPLEKCISRRSGCHWW